MEKVHFTRHIAKAISYRFLGTMQTTIISYIFTGDILIASSVGALEMCIKPIMYFLHERLWYKYIKFGIKKD